MANKETKEVNKKIDADNKVINACEDATLNINTILNSLKLLKKTARKIYSQNEATEELAKIINVVTADVYSMKSEIEDVASATADEIVGLKRQLEETEQG